MKHRNPSPKRGFFMEVGMTNWEKQRSVELKSAFLIREYQAIVQELFSNCANIPEFVELFSTLFPNYQESNARKMDPESIRERNISCSSAAALLGVWWMDRFPQLVPVFLVQNTEREPQSRSSAHVNVALPLTTPITPSEAITAFFDPNRRNAEIQLVDWTTHSGMKASNPQKAYDVKAIQGVHPYLRNRVQVLGLPKKYSTKNGVLAQTQ
ncbi:hypothetical protein H3C66_03015 [Patescibacteria group bacterium]|nr:hypothetical protein [Patescibacteria group bacterium]